MLLNGLMYVVAISDVNKKNQRNDRNRDVSTNVNYIVNICILFLLICCFTLKDQTLSV